MLGEDGAAKTLRDFAQFRGVPSARLDFVLEETLDFLGVRRGASGLQDSTNMSGDVGGDFFDCLAIRSARFCRAPVLQRVFAR